MICKCPTGRRDGKTSFETLITYMMTAKKKGQKKEERLLCSGTRNLATELRPLSEQIEEIYLLSMMNTRCRNPVFHGVISFGEGETPTEEQCREAVEIYLTEHNLAENQAVWAAHKDTKNIHIHVCANRIDIETLRAVHLEFYKKANERAARKIELAQGWSKTLSGHLAELSVHVNENGETHIEVVNRKRTGTERKCLSTGARDYEHRTGEKSAERIAQERAAKPLFESKSWAEVHSRLAEHGIELRQKGSGGILIVRGQPVKLSSVSRGVSWKKLTERLGDFIEREPSAAESHRQDTEHLTWNAVKNDIEHSKLSVVSEPEILDIKSTAEEQSLRKQYARERAKYYAEKRRIQAALHAWAQAQRNALKERHRSERETLYLSQNWKGHGNELNARRSILAFRQAQEKDRLKAEIARRREEFKQRYGGRFLSLVDWQRAHGREELAEVWRHRNSENENIAKPTEIFMLIYGQTYTTPQMLNYDMFNAEISTVTAAGPKKKDIFVTYRRKDSGRVAFIDRGHSICVLDSQDRTSTLAALKLAAQKWGVINVHGPKQFIDLVVELSAANGFRLRDPALQKRVEELREKQRKEVLRHGADTTDTAGDRSGDDFEAFIRNINAEIASINANEQAAREKSRDHIAARENRDAERRRLDRERERKARERKQELERQKCVRRERTTERKKDCGWSY